jgi:tetratricopeptide (TPR) repeat protein
LIASLPVKKKAIFYSIAVCIPLVFLVILEIGLRAAGVGDDLRLFTEASDPGYLRVNPIVAKRYLSKFGFTAPLNDQFLKKKPKNGCRIFVLGGSTVVGFPYDANISFSRILQYRLQNAFPEKRIEMVNTGLTAVNSYALLDFVDEILQQAPDAILIYAGHNEYYGALGVSSVENGGNVRWLKELHLTLIRFRLYQLVRNSVAWISQLIHPASLDEAKETLMQKIVGNNLVEYGSTTYVEGIDQFRVNMQQLLRKAKKAGVPVILSELVSNTRDVKPFESIRGGKYPPAIDVYEAARNDEHGSNFDKAREEYYRAKDLDGIKFRAPEDINVVLHDLGKEFDVPVVPMEHYFEEQSSHRLIGDNLMTEHLHPNIDGYCILSEGFLNALRQCRLIDTTWDTHTVPDWHAFRRSWGFTELDSAIADLRIKHLKSGWPFQPPGTVNNFRFSYVPHGFIDSLAFLTLKYNDITTAQMHQSLGEFYASKGEYRKAYKEYYALVLTYPFAKSYSYKCAQYLDLAKEYRNEVRVLQGMPAYETDLYAQLQCGRVFLELKDYGKSIDCLQRARANIGSENVLPVLKTLYVAYKDSGLSGQSQSTLEEIRKYDAGFSPDNAKSGRYIVLPQEVKPYIEKARHLIDERKLDEAAEVMRQSLQIRESAYQYLLLGSILAQQRKIQALPYLEKAYVEIKDDPALLDKLCVLYTVKRDYRKALLMLDALKKVSGTDDPRIRALDAMVHNAMKTKR